MKSSIKFALIIIVLTVFQTSRADSTVKTNSDNLQIELVFFGGAYSNNGFGGDILCGLTDLTSNQIISVVYQPEASYGCRFELFDTNGVAVPKTELGKMVGAFFSDLDPEVGLKKSNVEFMPRSGSVISRMPQVRLSYNGNEIKVFACHFYSGFARGTDQRRLMDSFCISNAGEYRLKLTYQVFELVGNRSLKLVRFPTIEKKIIVTPEDLKARDAAATTQKNAPSSTPTSSPARVKAVPPYQVQSSKILNISHASLTFAGYSNPESALETWLWASSRTDKTNMLKSLTPDQQAEFKSSFGRLTDAQIEEIKKNSSQFPGYVVRKMETVSDTEVVLSFVLKGTEAVQKIIIKKVGSEWKVAGPSPDSEMISTSAPAHMIINGEKH